MCRTRCQTPLKAFQGAVAAFGALSLGRTTLTEALICCYEGERVDRAGLDAPLAPMVIAVPVQATHEKGTDVRFRAHGEELDRFFPPFGHPDPFTIVGPDGAEFHARRARMSKEHPEVFQCQRIWLATQGEPGQGVAQEEFFGHYDFDSGDVVLMEILVPLHAYRIRSVDRSHRRP